MNIVKILNDKFKHFHFEVRDAEHGTVSVWRIGHHLCKYVIDVQMETIEVREPRCSMEDLDDAKAMLRQVMLVNAE